MCLNKVLYKMYTVQTFAFFRVEWKNNFNTKTNLDQKVTTTFSDQGIPLI